MIGKRIPQYLLAVLALGTCVCVIILSMFYTQYRWLAEELTTTSAVEHETFIEASFERYNPPKKLMIPNALGMEFEESCPGAVLFEVAGVTQRLEPTSTSDGGLFFVFADVTSGDETYGGGRFLYAGPPGPDGG